MAFTIGEAASFLGIAERTARKYVLDGKLSAELVEGSYKVDEGSAEAWKTGIAALTAAGENVKLYYALQESGISDKQISEELGICLDTIVNSTAIHRINRAAILDSYNIARADLFFTDEAAARLAIADRHIIYELIDEGDLRAVEFKRGNRKKIFVLKDSLMDLLGERSSRILYRSSDAAECSGKSINEIDRIAQDNGLGIKVKYGNKNSAYLFTRTEIEKLCYLNRHR